MHKLDYKIYKDKVLGCYLGVSVGGLIGAPYEGAKEIINVDIDFSVIDNMLYNDDLDLQVLFFQAVEKYGLNFNSNQLAKLFFEKCPYCPGEYAYFKKNYERGILPPYSGSFNNSFYSEGMGCCIRGELWGSLFPGNYKAIKKYAAFDGSQDHSDESVYSEYFVASMISAAFFTDNIDEIISEAVNQLPEESRFRHMIETVVKWCETENDINVLRRKIVAEFGHPDCTNVFQNLGFTVACLKLYFDNFENLLKMTVRCGFDTDCTGGIVAAVWGTVHGAEVMQRLYSLNDVKLVVGVDCPDYGGKVKNFADAVALHGVDFSRKMKSDLEILDAPRTDFVYDDIVLYDAAEYDPVLPFDTVKKAVIYAYVPESKKGGCFKYENDLIDIRKFEVTEEKDRYRLDIEVVLPQSSRVPANLKGTLKYISKDGCSDSEDAVPFGFAPPCVMEVSEPIYDTSDHLEFIPGKSYYDYFFEHEKNENKVEDNIRDYHLNFFIPEINDEDILRNISLGGNFEYHNSVIFTDKFNAGDLTGYKGACALYVRRTLDFPEENIYTIYCGCEAPVQIWLNGEKIAENKRNMYFTYENLHLVTVKFNKGINNLVMKIERPTGHENFSCSILRSRKNSGHPNHYLDYIQINNNKKG